MVKEISLVRVKILAKWIHDIAEEVENNKALSDEDIMILLLSLKDIMSDLNTEVTILIRENSQNKKWWIMVREIDLIKIEVLLQLQLGLIEEIHDNENLSEDEILEALEIIKNISEEINKDITVLLNQNSEKR